MSSTRAVVRSVRGIMVSDLGQIPPFDRRMAQATKEVCGGGWMSR